MRTKNKKKRVEVPNPATKLKQMCNGKNIKRNNITPTVPLLKAYLMKEKTNKQTNYAENFLTAQCKWH